MAELRDLTSRGRAAPPPSIATAEDAWDAEMLKHMAKTQLPKQYR